MIFLFLFQKIKKKSKTIILLEDNIHKDKDIDYTSEKSHKFLLQFMIIFMLVNGRPLKKVTRRKIHP
jgi:hypothetical protein